ncbi:MAG: Dabb family protein [Clostridia bacterium]|nr:Dabb family protein [Clostridia bacterium]
MKHCIIAKFKPEITPDEKAGIAEDVEAVFAPVKRIQGVHDVKVLRNCVPRPNRYDLMIEITMEREALDVYDGCEAHREWKQKYGSLLEQKAIFDYE